MTHGLLLEGNRNEKYGPNLIFHLIKHFLCSIAILMWPLHQISEAKWAKWSRSRLPFLHYHHDSNVMKNMILCFIEEKNV